MVEELNIELQGIKKGYDRPILENICLTISNHSYITIVGKSGSGKSTLMNILGLIEGFDEGLYRFNHTFIRNDKDYSRLRSNQIGFTFNPIT